MLGSFAGGERNGMSPREPVSPRRPNERAALAGLLLAGLLAGCDERPLGTMVAVEPPPGWEGRLAEDRSQKDQYFRQSSETPLIEADREGFTGLSYWAPDRRYYFVGRVNFYVAPERFEIIDTAGRKRPCERVGWIGLELQGTRQRLQVYRLLDSAAPPEASGLFLPFMDATTGRETYPAGRYVELGGAGRGPYVLDFNRAYNPYCAYGDPERFACPVTPPENRLSVPIEAGERGFRERGETS
jgi:uncharacterized protein (DUF1684 family)